MQLALERHSWPAKKAYRAVRFVDTGERTVFIHKKRETSLGRFAFLSISYISAFFCESIVREDKGMIGCYILG